jgi:hypothetical protein
LRILTFYGIVKIDSWRKILSNKLSAVSRWEPKDVADTVFIAKNFSFEWPEIIEEAKNKDLWVNPLDVSRIIKEFPVNLFDSIKWISPVDHKVLDKERLQSMMTFSMAGRIRWWDKGVDGLQIMKYRFRIQEMDECDVTAQAVTAGGEQIATTTPRHTKAELPFTSSGFT